MGEKYELHRVEAAALRALRFGATSYKPVERMLRLGLELQPLPGEEEQPEHCTPEHANVRGPGYYH